MSLHKGTISASNDGGALFEISLPLRKTNIIIAVSRFTGAVFKKNYPDTAIVATSKAFAMMRQFFGKDFSENGITVSDGDTLPLGTHTLHFVAAPMVRWPEVIVSYEETEKILFSADAFGKFGALDVKEDWADEARRYYIGIVGKYGEQVQALLKKGGGS